MHRTHDNFSHLINPGVYSSSEMMRLSTHIPVHASYRVNGVDSTLLRRWQVITGNFSSICVWVGGGPCDRDETTYRLLFFRLKNPTRKGNMPPENASRTDEMMVTGMVEDLLGAFMQNHLVELQQQELLKNMKKCLRCQQPLSLQGGDVDLGEKGAFHRGCFTCEDCGVDLFGQRLMRVEDKWLCHDSYQRLYLTPCPVCDKVIDRGLIRCGRDQCTVFIF